MAIMSATSSSLKRTTVMLPSDLRRRAFRRARERGVSLGALIRESLDAAIPRTAQAAGDDPLFSDGAIFRGAAPRDLARHHDRYLYGKP
jgi:hypothetical protein